MGSSVSETVVKPEKSSASDELSPKQRYEPIPIADKVTAKEADTKEPRLEAKTLTENLPDEALEESETILEKEAGAQAGDKTSKNTEDDDESVNYGYHPIIDFFGSYRFDAKAAK